MTSRSLLSFLAATTITAAGVIGFASLGQTFAANGENSAVQVGTYDRTRLYVAYAQKNNFFEQL